MATGKQHQLVIVTDGAADMPERWTDDYGINILPINIQAGGKTYLQGVNLDNARFYRLVDELHIIPKTSLPSPRQVIEFYNRVAKAGDTILSIHVGSKLSGTFSSVQQAAKDAADCFRIYPFDSGGGSAMLAFMCREARIIDRANGSIQDILLKLEGIRQRVTVIFTVENLDFAYMSGRVNRLQARLSSMLQIKPVIVLKDGLLDMAQKVRTRGRAMDYVADMVCQRMRGQKANVAIVHACDFAAAEQLATKIQAMVNCKDLMITELSIAVAAHLGPGTVGVVAYPVDED